ncbi:hypothetical protein ACHAW6_008646 [Cyclotella cf. meneghiniana]
MKLLTIPAPSMAALLLLTSTTNAFTSPIPRRSSLAHKSRTNIVSSRRNVGLRESITKKNDVETTATTNGATANGDVTDVTSSSSSEIPPPTAAATTPRHKMSNLSPDRIEKAIKERPYPLFLAEKTFALFDNLSSQNSHPPTGTKERLLVLGTGWGAAAFLKNIDCQKYDVTVVSPRNYFVFTPMLAGASVGTVDFKSITESIREINSHVRYLEAAATDIDPETNTVACVSISCEGNSCETEEFTLTYDRLIYTVGAQTNTYGTPGVEEYCNYLKQVGDAMQIKNAILNCFESAGLPDLSDEEKEKELTFVIIGAGPTGIEFAAELLDFIEEDGVRFYKDRLKYVRIKVVEATPTILRPFEDGMKEEATKRLTRSIEIEGVGTIQPCEILLNKQVSEVTENNVYFKDGDKVPYGMALWAAGIGQLPLTKSLVEALQGTEQEQAQEFSRGRLAVDPWLRVIGGQGKIFAMGDCSCLCQTPYLPATAQVAAQQGEFLGKLLSRNYVTNAMNPDGGILPALAIDPDQSKTISEQVASFAMGEKEIAPRFQFLDLGILAYTGSGSALAQVQVAPGKGNPNSERWTPVRLQIKGALGFSLWRTIYLLKQTSMKNVVLVSLDWIKVKLFGRDISIL